MGGKKLTPCKWRTKEEGTSGKGRKRPMARINPTRNRNPLFGPIVDQINLSRVDNRTTPGTSGERGKGQRTFDSSPISSPAKEALGR